MLLFVSLSFDIQCCCLLMRSFWFANWWQILVCPFGIMSHFFTVCHLFKQFVRFCQSLSHVITFCHILLDVVIFCHFLSQFVTFCTKWPKHPILIYNVVICFPIIWYTMLLFINEVILVCQLMTNFGVPFWYYVTFFHSLPFV